MPFFLRRKNSRMEDTTARTSVRLRAMWSCWGEWACSASNACRQDVTCLSDLRNPNELRSLRREGSKLRSFSSCPSSKVA